MSTDSGSETDGSLRVSIRIEPSSSLGMNSVPMNGSEPSAIVDGDHGHADRAPPVLDLHGEVL